MYSATVQVNFFDADPAGVLFFGNLFRLAHLAYEKMLIENNPEVDYFFHKDYLIPIIHTEADYRKPIMPGNGLFIEIVVSVLKRSSFELTYTFKNDKEEILANAKTVHVFINKNDWKKTPMPEELFEFLGKV